MRFNNQNYKKVPKFPNIATQKKLNFGCYYSCLAKKGKIKEIVKIGHSVLGVQDRHNKNANRHKFSVAGRKKGDKFKL